MKLALNKQLFHDTIRTSSQDLKIREEFIEKDYWITNTLFKLSHSNFSTNVVFKGGTSLTKAHKLINRFSEDIDLAIIHDASRTANQVKNLIRDIEKSITVDLQNGESELNSKGSRFRKTYYRYPSFYSNSSNNLIIEINSFANPFPYVQLEITSFIYDFLFQKNEFELIHEYNLTPVFLNVLSIEQTILEKLVSLFRTSFEQDLLNNISRKIRHFYDLYCLITSPKGKAFTSSNKFKALLDKLWEHDKTLFDEPTGWQEFSYKDSPLVKDFDKIWSKMAKVYKTEISALAFTEIPSAENVSEVFKNIFHSLN